MADRREELALRAAQCCLGLSSASDGFPKGVAVAVDSKGEETSETDLADALAKALEQAWPENVGSLSRTARLTAHDVAHLLNEVRRQRGSGPVAPHQAQIEKLMRHIVAKERDVVLVEIKQGRERKLVLVNTKISA